MSGHGQPQPPAHHDMPGHNHHSAHHDMAGHDMSSKGSSSHMMMMMYSTAAMRRSSSSTFGEISGIGGLILSMIICFLIAILYEAIKFTREVVFRKYNAPFIEPAKQGHDSDLKGLQSSSRDEEDPSKPKIRLAFHRLISPHAHIHDYNSWLCLSVVLGTAAGYFIFGWKRSSILDVSDHCH
ncbi:High affinity copper uptake protein 1 [Caligus rogercresseyi]|uniref:Copper transport protein n=1 Tax=Caligus rogercresseyi TaxID=217165 RepID=A0A7T8GVK2_CALRO|nr:High affinity copper uptake protein 1 [Caligus rogercresseyi]